MDVMAMGKLSMSGKQTHVTGRNEQLHMIPSAPGLKKISLHLRRHVTLQ